MTPRGNKRFAVPTRLRTAFLLATYSIPDNRQSTRTSITAVL